jgi:arsenate reductase (thioredoxin)
MSAGNGSLRSSDRDDLSSNGLVHMWFISRRYPKAGFDQKGMVVDDQSQVGLDDSELALRTMEVILNEVPEVLFVCVRNAGRSQMAAALLDQHADGSVHVRSAGSAPAGEIHSSVRTAMEEVGLDISKEFPKPLTDEVVQAADVVITMGCGDACPVYPGKRYLDWELEDPGGKTIDQVRNIRDEIDRRVRALLEELVPATR